ncbi:MAG: precorrin-2 dehydrogenase/sirohydrochlorin ferrochelatase [Candidatus Latescibacterota bacterium]|jgi:precorrin-2 dehydrogenase/sirohydrochlorin ferrochelatase
MPYPVVLNISGRLCAVVGAGKVAERKVEGLLQAGAVVRVIGTHPTLRIQAWADDQNIELVDRGFFETDLDDCWLVFAATNNADVNEKVAAVTRGRNILFCHSAGGEGDFTVPAVLNNGDLQVAVSTRGASPTYARLVRDYLDEHLSTGHGEVLTILKQARAQLKEAVPNDSIRRQNIWRSMLSQDIFEAVQAGSLDEVKQRIFECLSLSQD